MTQSYICRCSDLTAIQFTNTLSINTLPNDQAHIWIVEVPQCIQYINQFKTVLSVDELAKANTFHFKKDQDLYIIAHGLLRLILSEYTPLSPENLLFHHSEKGKPYLVSAGKKCYFNLSHASGIVLIAVNWLDEIGIDTEKIQVDFVWKDIAQYYFNTDEIACLEIANNSEATKLFFTYWTRKESFLKAIGAGLIDDIKSLEVSDAYNKFSLSNDEFTKRVRHEWKIISFPVTDTNIGSVALSPDIMHINFYQASELLHQ